MVMAVLKKSPSVHVRQTAIAVFKRGLVMAVLKRVF